MVLCFKDILNNESPLFTVYVLDFSVLRFSFLEFTATKFWLILILITVGCTYGAIQQLVFKIPFGTKPASDEVLAVLCMVPLIMFIVFRVFTLETKINAEGVFYRFKPMHFKDKLITWDEIEKIYTREYKPLKEYGGWGIKGSWKKGKAYNISGNKGIQLELKNGKKILLGTLKPQDVDEVIFKLKKHSS